MACNPLVPELNCADFARSLAFYTETLGFAVAYARPEQSFAFLEREGAQLMLEQLEQPPRSARSWLTGEVTHPFGRGINFQICVGDVRALLGVIEATGWPIFRPLEERWYRRDDTLLGNLQFLVQDPDGYLLRFFQDLGARPVEGESGEDDGPIAGIADVRDAHAATPTLRPERRARAGARGRT